MDRKIEKKPLFKSVKFLMGTVAGILVIVLLIAMLSDTSAKLNVDEGRITISEITVGDFQEFIPISGSVLPITTVYIDAVQGGSVERKFVEEGAFLNKGDRIVKLANIDLELNALQQESFTLQQINAYQNTRLSVEQNTINLKTRLQDARYNLKRTQGVLARQQVLWDKKLISQQEYELVREEYNNFVELTRLAEENVRNDSLLSSPQLKRVDASIDRLETNLQLIRESIDNLTIRAPISGLLTSLPLEIGESKSVGERLGQIDVLNGYKVRGVVDEFYLSRISRDLEAGTSFGGNEYKLKVTKVFSEVKDGRFEVEMLFADSTPEGIKRGLTLQIKLELGDNTKATLLPRGGFYEKTGGRWIFVLDESSRHATKRTIRIGRQNPNYFEVLEGLHHGDRVITSSYDSFGVAERIELN